MAVNRGRLEEARALLDAGLELSLAVRSTRNVGLYLPAFAQIREALGSDRFEEVFAAGARLNRREADAMLRDRGGTGARVP